MDIKVKGKYEDKPLKVKENWPILKNIRIRSKYEQNNEETENRQNPQNYAEYMTFTTSKKVAEKSILAISFSAKRLKIKKNQHTPSISAEQGEGPVSGLQVIPYSVKKQKHFLPSP